MATMFCTLCGRPVDAKRHIGIGTGILAIFTGGLSLLAIPFYKKRCSICKSEAVTESDPSGRLASANSSPHGIELQRRLARSEEELDAMNTEIEQLRTERDFYKQLLGDRARERGDPP